LRSKSSTTKAIELLLSFHTKLHLYCYNNNINIYNDNVETIANILTHAIIKSDERNKNSFLYNFILDSKLLMQLSNTDTDTATTTTTGLKLMIGSDSEFESMSGYVSPKIVSEALSSLVAKTNNAASVGDTVYSIEFQDHTPIIENDVVCSRVKRDVNSLGQPLSDEALHLAIEKRGFIS
jgi:hypothetical protein